LKTKVNDNKEAGFISEAKDFAVFSRKKDKEGRGFCQRLRDKSEYKEV